MITDEYNDFEEDFANLSRLAAQGTADDARLFIAKLVRRYRAKHPDLALRLQESLKAVSQTRSTPNILRRGHDPSPPTPPVDRDSKLSLVRVFDDRNGIEMPILPEGLLRELRAIVDEHLNRPKLEVRGISPTRSAMFVGPPGVGKTITARWVAAALQKPLWVLDLTTVMSSLLGRTGTNLRAVFEETKTQQAILLLDEIDAIAKRRGDESDIGELKRLVAGILQELDTWPSTSLLLAATNHPEAVDPALWRRFDAVLQFPKPTRNLLEAGIARYLGPSHAELGSTIGVLAALHEGEALSEVERSINRLRRQLALDGSIEHALADLIQPRIESLDGSARRALAVEMAKTRTMPHNRITELTGVSRDTLRKYAGPSPIRGRPKER